MIISVHIRKFAILKGSPSFVYTMSSEDEVQQLGVTEHLYSANSPYQQIDIYQTDEFGAVLFLDNDISE